MTASLRRLVLRLRNLFQPERSEPELAREVASHLALMEADFQRRGMSAEQAKLAALRSFGGVERAKDLHRDARSIVWLDDLRRDLQYAGRTLRRAPGFSAVVIVTLALGIGANTAIFSVVHGVLLQPLPYRDSAGLVRVWENVPAAEMFNGRAQRYPAMDLRDVLSARDRSQTLTHIVTFGLVRPTTTIGGDVTRMDGFGVSIDMFEMLGVEPLIGRTFTADEGVAGHEHVLVLGYDAWQRFGGNPQVLGRMVTFGGDPTNPMLRGVALDVEYTVIGVMPRGFRFPYDNAQFWVPRVMTVPANGRPFRTELVARLADGASPEAAAQELEAIRRDTRGAAEIAGDRPRFEVKRLQDDLTAAVRPALFVLMAAVGVVLLIACVNVANLLLARTASRQREIAVRAAIGAGRGRLVRQLITESLLLSGIGGVAGTLLAFSGVRLFRVLGTTLGRADLGMASAFPRLDEVAVDGTVLGYALTLSLVTGLAFGLAPALRHSRSGQPAVLRETTTAPRTGLTSVLVVVEIALATLLFVGGGLLINSFSRLATVDPGFDPAHLLTFQVSASGSRRPDEQKAFAEALVERLRSMPGIEAAGYARQLPMVQLQDSIVLTTKRNGVDQVLGEAADIRFVSRDYLKAMGIRLLAGRGFTEKDGPGQPGVVLVNEALARRDFPRESPLSTIVTLGRPPRTTTLEIVGVVANVRQSSLDREPQPQYFLDYRQLTSEGFVPPPLFPVGAYYTVRTATTTALAVDGVRTIVRQLDAKATIDNIATMEQIVSNSVTRPRMYAVLLGIFAGVAVALAAIGLYGMMSYAVTRRTREIGIRMALGAHAAQVTRLVLRQSTALTVIGLSLGLLGAAASSRYLSGLLFGLTPLDPETFVAVAASFATITMLASWIPARRATTVDPLIALRAE